MSGLPLLSGPPPSSPESEACRKCGKEFNILFTRSRKCNHCGYHYCNSCSDYQALMPRRGPENGYVPTNVCGFCIEHLNITAGGKNQLKSLPIGRLRKYANAYNIRIDRAVEKDDIIDAVIAARGANGCLSPSQEDYYRQHSVPVTEPRSGLRNLFRGSPPPAPPPPPPPPHRRPGFARPDLEPDPPRNNDRPPPPPPRPTQPQYHYTQPPGPPPPSTQYQGHYGSPYTYSPQPHPPPNQYPGPQSYYEGPYGPPPNPPPRPHSGWEPMPQPGLYPPYNAPPGYGYQQGGYVPQSYGAAPPPPPPPPQNTRPSPQAAPPPPPPPPRPQQPQQQSPQAQGSASTSRPQPASRSAAPPTLDALLEMSSDDISALSIGALKQILFTNHVNAGQVLEKGELVKKVVSLVEDEKRERERQRRVLEMEEMERLQRERERLEEQERERERRRERERAAEEEARRNREREEEERRNRERRSSGGGPQTRIHIVNLGPAASEDGMSEYGEGSPVTPDTTSGPYTAHHREESFSQRSTTPKPPPQPSFKPPTMERTGLCVVCQDEEANIAIIDCG